MITGIPAHVQHKLFKSFAQVDAATARKFGGTGLGLAISKHLVESMGGSIWIESTIDRGSIFHFTVKLPGSNVGKHPHMLKPAKSLFTNVHVLLIMPNIKVLQIYCGLLANWGITVDYTTDALHALQLLKHNHKYNGILIDYKMQYECTTNDCAFATVMPFALWIRKSSLCDNIPTMLFTDLNQFRNQDEIRQCSSMVLPLPIKPNQLFVSLQQLFNIDITQANIDIVPAHNEKTELMISVQPAEQIDSTSQSVVVPTVITNESTILVEQNAASNLVHPQISKLVDLTTHHSLAHPLRILIAEDITINQKILCKMLGQLGYSSEVITVASNGKLAVDAVLKQLYPGDADLCDVSIIKANPTSTNNTVQLSSPIDVILMDVFMPVMDGLQASRAIRSHSYIPVAYQPFIVAVTANAMQGDIHKCYDSGMDIYLSKPITLAGLTNTLSVVYQSLIQQAAINLISTQASAPLSISRHMFSRRIIPETTAPNKC